MFSIAAGVRYLYKLTHPTTPKDDFYTAVNEKWLTDPANAIPGEYSSWGGFTKLHDEGLKLQIQMVKDLKLKQNKTEEEAKISAIWEASATRFHSWSDKGDGGTIDAITSELKQLTEILGTSGAGQDLVTRVARYLHYTQTNGIGNILDFDKGSDLKNTNNVVLDLSICGLSLPSREYYTEDSFAEKRTKYEQHLTRTAELVKRHGVTLVDNFVEKVLAFEHELALVNMKPEQAREYPLYYTNTTLEAVYKKANELISLPAKESNYPEDQRDFRLNAAQLDNAATFFEELYTLFNFRAVMAKNHAKHFSGDPNGPDPQQVTTFDGDGIRRVLAMIFDPANFDKYVAFLQYKVIKAHRSYCTKELDDEFFGFYNRELSGQTEQKPEEKRSIGAVNAFAGEMMGKVFVAKMFPPECKQEMAGMIDETLQVMRESITNSDWLTAETKEKALVKLDKFRVKIGYPDEWKDYSAFDVKAGDSLYTVAKKAHAWALQVEFFDKLNSVLDRNEWRMTPQTVNAYFMPTQNEIVFPAAILQPPFYNKAAETVDFDVDAELAMAPHMDLRTAANFGAIGSVIAHEITHGYDDKGRQFDGNGNLNDWWTEEDGKLFEAKTKIMAKQAEKYRYVEPDGQVHLMKPSLTMGENLADLGGMSLSLGALRKRLVSSNASKEETDAAFRVAFKAWANVWKLNISRDSRINRLTTDPHAPCDFRANLVANMQEFYDVFGVSPGDAMYIPPQDRLRMW